MFFAAYISSIDPAIPLAFWKFIMTILEKPVSQEIVIGQRSRHPLRRQGRHHRGHQRPAITP
jgi:hypothetical protein